MENPEHRRLAQSPAHGQVAEQILWQLFTDAGWQVTRQLKKVRSRPDLLVRRGDASYVVEVKSASEGRSDRLVPLWAQAYLQALHHAADTEGTPLVVVAAPRIPRRVGEQVLEFAAEYAPGAAAGVVDGSGLRMFRGPHLDELNTEVSHGRVHRRPTAMPPANLFSDLNQWLLKVLLAPELPETMLTAPRARYRNASELARAANVSVMSASRFLRQLQHEGFLHESKPCLDVVRREDLFRRWQMAGGRRVREMPFRSLLRRDPREELRRIAQTGDACLALFAAAEALGLGFVHGIPPHLYVRRLDVVSTLSGNLVPAEPNEAPDIVVREAPTPNSIFRGAVETASLHTCDVVQVWIDTSWHPSRGQEQAESIRRTILAPVIEREVSA